MADYGNHRSKLPLSFAYFRQAQRTKHCISFSLPNSHLTGRGPATLLLPHSSGTLHQLVLCRCAQMTGGTEVLSRILSNCVSVPAQRYHCLHSSALGTSGRLCCLPSGWGCPKAGEDVPACIYTTSVSPLYARTMQTDMTLNCSLEKISSELFQKEQGSSNYCKHIASWQNNSKFEQF